MTFKFENKCKNKKTKSEEQLIQEACDYLDRRLEFVMSSMLNTNDFSGFCVSDGG